MPGPKEILHCLQYNASIDQEKPSPKFSLDRISGVGAEWIFYMFGRMDHYVKVNRRRMPTTAALPQKDVEDYAKCGRIFIAPESDDPMLVHEIALLGDSKILFFFGLSSREGRENAALSIIQRGDLTADQKRKILYDNPIIFSFAVESDRLKSNPRGSR